MRAAHIFNLIHTHLFSGLYTAALKNCTVAIRGETLVVSGWVQVTKWAKQWGQEVMTNSSVCNDGVWGASEAEVACRMVFGEV